MRQIKSSDVLKVKCGSRELAITGFTILPPSYEKANVFLGFGEDDGKKYIVAIGTCYGYNVNGFYGFTEYKPDNIEYALDAYRKKERPDHEILVADAVITEIN